MMMMRGSSPVSAWCQCGVSQPYLILPHAIGCPISGLRVSRCRCRCRRRCRSGQLIDGLSTSALICTHSISILIAILSISRVIYRHHIPHSISRDSISISILIGSAGHRWTPLRYTVNFKALDQPSLMNALIDEHVPPLSRALPVVVKYNVTTIGY